MWEVLSKLPRGRLSLRNFPLLATAFLMAIFLVTPLFSTAEAVGAERSGSTVTYEGKTYSQIDKSASPSQLPPSVSQFDGFVSFDTSAKKAYYLLTSGPADKATSAEYTVFDMPTIGSYGNNSPPVTVSISDNATSATESATKSGTKTTCDSSQTGGVGWIVCPVVEFLAKGMDAMYGIVSNFLVVRTVTTDTNSSLYRMWSIVRDLANLCFVGAFLVIIYSQVTGIGYSNYNLKKMLPRLIIGAILVNISFWLSAGAVDASNILGYSIHDIFASVLKNLNGAGQYSGAGFNETNIPTWSVLAGSILAAGGTIAGVAIAVDTGAIFALIPALIGAILAALAAFIILAARQALIVCLIIISPLAFVAMLLPNTEKYFDKWRSAFMMLLLVFPIFSVVFSGAQLAGLAIIQSANDNVITLILGMTVQVAPLFITPLILKFSGGLIGKVASLVNNPNKGLIDRSRNWANDRQKHRRLQVLNRSDRYFGRSPKSWSHRAIARSTDRRRREREMMDKENEHNLDARAGSSYQQTLYSSQRRQYRYQRDTNRRAHEHEETGKSYKERMDSSNEEHWQNHLYSPAGKTLRDIRELSHTARGRAKVTEDAMQAANERVLQSQIHNDATLSARKVQTAVDTGVAKLTADNIDAHGKLALQNQVMNDRSLRKLKVDSHEQTKRAETIESMLQSRADVHWGHLQVRDPGIQQQMQEAAINKGVAKVMEDAINASHQRAVEIHIDRSQSLRDMKIKSISDTEVAKVIASDVESAGQRAAQEEIARDRDLQKKVSDSYENQQVAATIKNTHESNAKSNWNHLSRSDDDIRSLKLDEMAAAENAKVTEERWNTLVSNIKSEGGATPGLTNPDEKATADAIRQAGRDVRVEKMAQESAAVEEGRDFADTLHNDPALIKKAAGVGGEAAERRVYAKAKKQAFEPIMESIKNIDDTMSHELGSNPDALYSAFTDPDSTFDQRIAYAKRMSKTGGPGNMRLREAIDFIDNEYAAGRISDDDLQGYKELILTTSDAAPSGKDIEFWLTNSRDSAGNMRSLRDLANDTGVWGGIAADAFAGMNMVSQMKALRTMARHSPDKFIALRDNIPENVRARLKPNVVEALQHSPGDPYWSDPAKDNDPADDLNIY